MAIGDFFKSILGTKAPEPVEPVTYKGFTIEPLPIDDDGKYRTAGYISGVLDGEIQRIQFIRADQLADRQAAIDYATTKAKQIIDEQGVGLLKKKLL